MILELFVSNHIQGVRTKQKQDEWIGNNHMRGLRVWQEGGFFRRDLRFTYSAAPATPAASDLTTDFCSRSE